MEEDIEIPAMALALKDHFDPAVIMAYSLLIAHVQTENVDTAMLPRVLDELAEVFKKHQVEQGE